MQCSTFDPGNPLAQYVEMIWFISNGAPGAAPHLVCPNAAMDLVIHLDDSEISLVAGDDCYSVRGPVLAGPYSRAFFIQPAEFTAVLGVRFKPGAARLFFPVPAHELHNIDIGLSDAFPGEAELIREKLLSTRGLTRQVETLKQYLLRKLASAPPLDRAVEHAVREFRRNPGSRAVAEVQSETGLSHTRFIQLFRQNVGMPPKLFCRVQRFQKAVLATESGFTVNWAEVAATCGYFDQAHLIRDFRAFSGLTPLAYAEARDAYRSAGVAAAGPE